MTKTDIAQELVMKHGMTKQTALDLVEDVLDLVKETLIQGEEVKIAGFGKFCVQAKADRRGRNPQTGEDITIGARKIVTWKASHILKSRLNQ